MFVGMLQSCGNVRPGQGSGTRPTPFQLCTLSPRAVSRLRQCVRSSQIVAATGFCHITEGRSRTSSRDPSNGILLQSGFNRLAAALAAAADAAEAIATERTADAGSGASDESSAYQALHGVLAAVAADVKAVKDAIMDRAADGRQRKMQLQRQRRHQQRHPESPQPGARRQAMQMTRQQKRPDTAHLENTQPALAAQQQCQPNSESPPPAGSLPSKQTETTQQKWNAADSWLHDFGISPSARAALLVAHPALQQETVKQLESRAGGLACVLQLKQGPLQRLLSSPSNAPLLGVSAKDLGAVRAWLQAHVGLQPQAAAAVLVSLTPELASMRLDTRPLDMLESRLQRWVSGRDWKPEEVAHIVTTVPVLLTREGDFGGWSYSKLLPEVQAALLEHRGGRPLDDHSSAGSGGNPAAEAAAQAGGVSPGAAAAQAVGCGLPGRSRRESVIPKRLMVRRVGPGMSLVASCSWRLPWSGASAGSEAALTAASAEAAAALREHTIRMPDDGSSGSSGGGSAERAAAVRPSGAASSKAAGSGTSSYPWSQNAMAMMVHRKGKGKTLLVSRAARQPWSGKLAGSEEAMAAAADRIRKMRDRHVNRSVP